MRLQRCEQESNGGGCAQDGVGGQRDGGHLQGVEHAELRAAVGLLGRKVLVVVRGEDEEGETRRGDEERAEAVKRGREMRVKMQSRG